MDKGKFVIDGEIELKPESTYLNQQKSVNFKRLKIVLICFILLCSMLLIWSLYLTGRLQTIETEKKLMSQKIKIAETLIQENTAYKERNDTLQKRIIQLRKDNDILAENTDSVNGIFFEVQIGNFYDFNIDAYMNELEALRQEKSGNNSKLILGRFRSFKKAMLFENDIKKMGFANAFLVGRIDGKLVDYQEALSAYQRSQSK